jgi:sulfoquinovose isomerase
MESWIEQATHREWLRDEGVRLLAFGRRCLAPGGGAGWLDATGALDPDQPVFTWVTARMAHVYGLGHLLGLPGCRPIAERALEGLDTTLRDAESGGWFHAINPDGTRQDAKTAYGHAFVILAASTGVVAGLPRAEDLLADALKVFDVHFWDPEASLSRDSWDARWSVLDPYRGINANMHTVEAFLAASDATGDQTYTRRALAIAERVAQEWAQHSSWRIPEHFNDAWEPNFEFNADHVDDPFKPYGATVGHGLEWSRLLLHIHASLPESPSWLVTAAEGIFHRAVADGWAVDGAPGFVYTTDWAGAPVVRTRLHWVAAEGIAAAAALLQTTGERRYAVLYADWWDYAEQYLIDRVGGSWHHELDAHNQPKGTVWAGKPDLYHAFQATLFPRAPLTPSLAVAAKQNLIR